MVFDPPRVPERAHEEGDETMPDINEAVVTYLAAWNETDTERRRALVARAWAEGGAYVDAHRKGEGHAGLDAMIAAAQGQFPGYRLRLISTIEAHGGGARFGWAAGGTADAPLYLAGTDFVTLAADGRFDLVTGFIDAAPASV